ncbi:MAG: DUF115 domain-containing protein, partial [Spirochaetales bacterium]|nr:DUF115 domain-containing protein [Spirochaetales bacterium]
NRLTMSRMGPLWMRNFITNLPLLAGKDIAGFKTDKNIMLCGAGESLEGTIPYIRSHRDSLYLLAVDTAVQHLCRNDLVPDGVVNLEAQFYNLKDFYPVLHSRIDLFSDITAYPASLRQECHNQYFFASSFQETSLHRKLRALELLPREIPPLGSVGVAALYLAGELTRGTVFITGLDFSYLEGKTHARETPFHDWCRLQETRLKGDVWYSFSRSRPSTPADALPPGAVTNRILESYARQLEDIARTMPGRVINLAERGMKMSIPGPGTELPAERAVEPPSAARVQKKNTTALWAFIRKEKEILEDLIRIWDDVCAGRAGEEELLPLLSVCDYLYFHFPDRETLPHTEPVFLFRVMKEARSLVRRFSIPT